MNHLVNNALAVSLPIYGKYRAQGFLFYKGGILIQTAILVDGGFYRKRAQNIIGDISAEQRDNELYTYCHRHLSEKNHNHELYRIFYYDCPPMDKKIYHPLLKRQVDFSKTDLCLWMTTFLDALKTKRKLALRLGKLSDSQACYTIRQDRIKKICNGSLQIPDLTEEDFMIHVTQKGVDMKIGLDIATLAYKKQVNQIVLISGDSDFVPAIADINKQTTTSSFL